MRRETQVADKSYQDHEFKVINNAVQLTQRRYLHTFRQRRDRDRSYAHLTLRNEGPALLFRPYFMQVSRACFTHTIA